MAPKGLAGLGSALHHDLEWLETELAHDYAHAKHFIGDAWGHLEHVRAWRGGARKCARGARRRVRPRAGPGVARAARLHARAGRNMRRASAAPRRAA